MELAVGIHFSFSPSQSKVVDVRAVPVWKTLSAVEGKFCEAGLAGGTESVLQAIRWGTRGVGVVDRDFRHEEGTRLEAIESSRM